ANRLQQLGLTTREMALEDLWRIHYELLNPSRARAKLTPPTISLRDTLWNTTTVRAEGSHLLEYTEAEQLCFEDLEERPGNLFQAGVHRRVATLKVLPEGGTGYFSAEPLLSLATQDAAGDSQPFSYTLSVSVHIQPQGRKRWLLSAQHGLVDALKHVI